MSDNIRLNAGTGGKLLAADDVGGASYQRVKVGVGDDGVATDVSSNAPMPVTRYDVEVARGNITGQTIIHKFGRNTAVGTTFVPVTIGGVYQTPQPASATTLRIKAGGNANDTAAGTGAREITLEGLDASGNLLTETLATNGTSASSATSGSFLRLFRCYVSGSGTYATASAGSHAGDIVIENSGGGTDWAIIDSGDFPRSQSEIGAYSIPAGKTGYIERVSFFADTTKTTDVLFFKRGNILETAAPYTAMRAIIDEKISGGGETSLTFDSPIMIAGPADIGVLAKVDTGTAEVDVEFEILIVDN